MVNMQAFLEWQIAEAAAEAMSRDYAKAVADGGDSVAHLVELMRLRQVAWAKLSAIADDLKAQEGRG